MPPPLCVCLSLSLRDGSGVFYALGLEPALSEWLVRMDISIAHSFVQGLQLTCRDPLAQH